MTRAAVKAPSEKLWTQAELAEHLDVSERTVEDWRYKGDGPPVVHAGRSIRYVPADVRAWLRRRSS